MKQFGNPPDLPVKKDALTLETAADALDTMDPEILSFLKKRLRPLVLLLIQKQDIRRTRLLYRMGWLNAQNASSFLLDAQRSGNSDLTLFFLQIGHPSARMDKPASSPDGTSLCLQILKQSQHQMYAAFPFLDSVLFTLLPEPMPGAGAYVARTGICTESQSACIPQADMQTDTQGEVVPAADMQTGISCRKPPAPTGRNFTGALGTDGSHIYFDTDRLLRLYQDASVLASRQYCHLILHFLFFHIPLRQRLEAAYDKRNRKNKILRSRLLEWFDLACDILVEYDLDFGGFPSVTAPCSPFRERIYSDLFTDTGPSQNLSSFQLMPKLMHSDFPLSRLKAEFTQDTHRFWSLPLSDADASPQTACSESGAGDGETGNKTKGSAMFQQRQQLLQRFLHSAARRHASRPGQNSGNKVQEPEDTSPGTFDYGIFLRRFASMGEELELDMDSFDLIYYTWGLTRYEKIPLIEPLEYRDLYKIQELVLAIDTSGSCSGELVQRFLQETFTILGTDCFFFRRCRLHLIQCDCGIQDHQVITCREEFEAYRKTPLKGFGGTDFRPVFALTEKLIREKELQDLKGLIYFTDGEGIFPDHAPSFQSAFVFIPRKDPLPKLPDWAIRLILPD